MNLQIGYKFHPIILQAKNLKDFELAVKVIQNMKKKAETYTPKLTSTYYKKLNSL